jgi:hypothetical protein
MGKNRETLFAALNAASLAFDKVLHTLVQLCDPGILGRINVLGSEFVEGVDTGENMSDQMMRNRSNRYIPELSCRVTKVGLIVRGLATGYP